MLMELLFGAYRQRALGLLLLHPESSYHVREIARLTGTCAGTLHKELSRLAQVGVLLRQQRGNQVLYQANRACPIFPELASLFRKTSGLVDVLADSLQSLGSEIAFAFVFGSMARGDEQPLSDVDLMVVGTADFAQVVAQLYPAQEQIQREINPVVYSLQECMRRFETNDFFIKQVLAQPKLWVIGTEDDFGKFIRDSQTTKV